MPPAPEPTPRPNAHAARAEAVLAAYFAAETDEDLAAARRKAARIAAMSDADVAALSPGGEDDAGPAPASHGPERHARRARPFSRLARAAAARGDRASAQIYQRQAREAGE